MPDIARLDAAARRLRELHQIGRPLLLVNVWDAAGARAIVAAGSAAVATSSVAMAAARGGSDGNRDREAAFAQLRQITAAVDVPVTADLEGGYDLASDDLVDALLDAGAVGCNIEDTDHATGDSLLDAEARAVYLAAIRAAADRRGVGIVLNARIDAIIRHPQRDPAAAMDEVLRRARLYLDAGADCVYPIRLRDPALVAQVVKELDRPVNANPSEPLAALAEAGAARISLGGGVHNWMVSELERRARRLFDGDATAFT
ncbi:MAG: carboxyvinyl-carboxyphosphonate phosphorylmutase [Acidimicrobiales bacterium]|jgi:2-methylisocitrate lyase-like PEP mutase family enzyme|nr:carboxyvinyl-carboxyphosphonate phosphorylmutase [Acidimicrobiales bacterium]